MPECAAVGEAAETVHQEEEVPVDDHLRGVRLLHLLPAAGGRHALHHLGVPGHTTPHGSHKYFCRLAATISIVMNPGR